MEESTKMDEKLKFVSRFLDGEKIARLINPIKQTVRDRLSKVNVCPLYFCFTLKKDIS